MTKIFITIPWFLPAFRAGGPIQSVANLVKEFHKGVEYFIFCGDVDLNSAALENIERNKWNRFNEYTQVWYAEPKKISDSLILQVEKQKPDILFIIGMFSWHFNIVPIMYCKAPEKILSARGMMHPGALTQKKWKKKFFLQLFKLFKYHHKIIFHATNEEESNYIRKYFGESSKVFIAGNFPNKIGVLPIIRKEPGKLKIVTIALISRMKNILLVLEGLEKLVANIQYDIYGPVKDEEYWDLCKEKIKQLPSNINVVYHKELQPMEIKTVLSKEQIFVLPSKSENFGHSIYEALSAGRPVITSENTPWNHLSESKAGINISLKNIDELSSAIDFFAMMENREMEEWSRGAYEYSKKEVNVGEIKREYGRMFKVELAVERSK